MPVDPATLGRFHIPHLKPLTFSKSHRFSQPNWAQFHALFENRESTHYKELQQVAAREWMQQLFEELGEGYELRRSSNFIVLAPIGRAQRVAEYCEQMRANIRKTLSTAAVGQTCPIPVLCFNSTDAYCDYIHDFIAETRVGATGGMFIHNGYGHFALPFHNFARAEHVIVHELAHAQIRNLQIPLWLNEGIAQLFEVSLAGTLSWRMDEIKDKIPGYWTPQTVSEFIFNNSFVRSDDGQILSYHLAFVLTKKLVGDLPRFRLFVDEASASDGGDSALSNHYGLGLNELISDYLGEGDWLAGQVGQRADPKEPPLNF